MSDKFTIEDLEKHSGLSIRTLHYYMQIGLLPGPEKSGKYAIYSQEHLDRLDLILILKEMHLPLKEIRVILNTLTPSEIVHYIDYQEDLLEKIKGDKPVLRGYDQFNKQSKALDYIKNYNEAFTMNKFIAYNQSNINNKFDKSLFDNSSMSRFFKKPTDLEQQIWRRIILYDGVELNVRDTGDKELIQKIERLLSFARSLFEN